MTYLEKSKAGSCAALRSGEQLEQKTNVSVSRWLIQPQSRKEGARACTQPAPSSPLTRCLFYHLPQASVTVQASSSPPYLCTCSCACSLTSSYRRHSLQNDHPRRSAVDGGDDHGCDMHPLCAPLACMGRHVHVSADEEYMWVRLPVLTAPKAGSGPVQRVDIFMLADELYHPG